MALRDDEQRELAEIERGLLADDPRLAGRLTERPHPTMGPICGVIMLLVVGFVIMVAGVQLQQPLLVVIGSIVAGTLPAMIPSSRP